ncbi:MAG: DUF438 domain-containing protein, partial [Halanaerobiaceae bacterium]|nr:DUF438 domain-containing protein [Halanaerobiaceae bacterium]
ILEMEDRQVRKGIKPVTIKKHIEKILNVIGPHLTRYPWKKPEKGLFLYYMMEENRELERLLKGMKGPIKRIELESRKKGSTVDIAAEMKKLADYLKELKEFNKHYLKKENVLFPYLEQKWDYYRPLRVMWSVHDDIRKEWKALEELLKNNKGINDELRRHFGILFMLMFKMVFKEENILFPAAMETLEEKEWDEIARHSAEIGYVFIEPEEISDYGGDTGDISAGEKAVSGKDFRGLGDISLMDDNLGAGRVLLGLGTGVLDIEELLIILNSLPLDITYVDENDRVKYYSNPADRIFPRSPAIIGRSVQNCHPPESIHVVNRILEAFRSGEKERASFWIKMKERFILIQYFALRDNEGNYRGTLEVSQDITGIKELEGEKRLLDF